MCFFGAYRPLLVFNTRFKWIAEEFYSGFFVQFYLQRKKLIKGLVGRRLLGA